MGCTRIELAVPVPGPVVLDVMRPAPEALVPVPRLIDSMVLVLRAGEMLAGPPRAVEVPVRPAPVELTVPAPRVPQVVELIAARPHPPEATVGVPRLGLAVPVPDVTVALPVPAWPGAGVAVPVVELIVARPHVELEVCAPPIWWRILTEFAVTAEFGADLAASMGLAAELAAVGQLTAQVEVSMAHAATLAASGRLTAALSQRYVSAPVMACMASFAATVSQAYARDISARATAAMTAQLSEALTAGQRVPIAASMSVVCSTVLTLAANFGVQAAMTALVAYPALAATVVQLNAGSNTVPYNATIVDTVALGASAGGEGGGWAIDGKGGGAGQFGVGTINRGMTGVPAVLNVALGVGGARGTGGAAPGRGGDGTGTVISWDGGSVTGPGGLNYAGSNATGLGVTATNYQGRPFSGGGPQSTKGANGNAPGGGAAGGGRVPFFGSNGGVGAPGAAWAVYRSS